MQKVYIETNGCKPNFLKHHKKGDSYEHEKIFYHINGNFDYV
jgi:hypothetical protein